MTGDAQTFLEGRVTLRRGNCREVLKSLPDNSVDAVATDPPYALDTIVDRFGAEDAAEVEQKDGAAGVFARGSAGFMGQAWDTGEEAFDPAFWREVARVLKPGGHVAAFGHTRTYHRLAVALELAGFEIRDQLAWVYGTGFPKSHNVAKGIDETLFYRWLEDHPNVAERRRRLLKWAKSRDKRKVSKGLRRRIDEAFRIRAGFLKVVGKEVLANDMRNSALLKAGKGEARASYERSVVVPATPEAEEWDGWGTALKPAWEPIALARKPLAEHSVAANVLRWGLGAINIRACRIAVEKVVRTTRNIALGSSRSGVYGAAEVPGVYETPPEGRYPANIVIDGSKEVVALFPESEGATGVVDGQTSDRKVYNGGVGPRPRMEPRGDAGSASRFFYSAKADDDDRNGFDHPTVKPVDLMRWLVRMICPKGGTVLDPFAGTGTTGEAAYWEGCTSILVEKEDSYQSYIVKRMGLVLAGRDERKRARTKADPPETLPLFSGTQVASIRGTSEGGDRLNCQAGDLTHS